MAKSESEISRELKDFIYDLQSDAHNAGNIKKYRYNNLKIEVTDPRLSKIPEIKITIGISEATFNIITKEKISGGLGPDERYIIRWLNRDSTGNELKAIYKQAVASMGKAYAKGE